MQTGRPSRFVLALVLGIALFAVVATVWATWRGGERIWGVDAYAHLSPAALPAGLVALVLLAFALPAALAALARRERASASHRGVAAFLPGLLLPLVAGAAFWLWRARHVLLGDGIPITVSLPDDPFVHPREPLAGFVQQVLWRWLARPFSQPDASREQVVMDVVALGSVLAGMVFVASAWWLGRELERAGRDSRAEPAAADRSGVVAAALAFAMLAQGYVQLYFGYVETYPLYAAALGLFLLAGLRCARGAGRLAAPLAAFALALGMHLSAIVLAPALLVLAAARLRERSRRAAAVRDLAIAVGVAVALLATLAATVPGARILPNLRDMLASARAQPGYLGSRVHVLDFLNEHLLIGPFGLLLFVPVALLALAHWRRRVAGHAFLWVAGACAAVSCALMPDLPLGYARDWDLLAPFGIVLTVAGLGLALPLAGRDDARRLLGVVLAVSLFHTVPWIALNGSETRSFARFKTLPLGGGRTESTVAFWHFRRGELAEAETWVKRAIVADPGNVRAVDLFGRIALLKGDPALAVRAYRVAVDMRPDKIDYHLQLAFALDRAGDPAAGLHLVDSLAAAHPDHGLVWLQRSLLLESLGRRDEAAASAERAVAAWPHLAGRVQAMAPRRGAPESAPRGP